MLDSLQPTIATHTFDFAGHGTASPSAEGMSMNLFADEIIQFIEKSNLQTMHVFGYSMGGYAAIFAAQKRPELFSSITTLGTKLDWTSQNAATETRMLDADKMQVKVPQFVNHLQKIHINHDWRSVLEETRRMMIDLGDHPMITLENISSIKVPLQILVGENDTTAGVEASKQFANSAHANFQILENTPHPIEKVDLQSLTALVLEFIDGIVSSQL